MNRKSLWRSLLSGVVLVVAGLQGALAAPTATVPLQSSPSRATTMTIWEPAQQARGVVLFSTGHGAWPERYEGLMQAWTRAGFVVVAPLHVDSMHYPERDRFTLQQMLPERLADMRAASAYVATHWPKVPVAAAGHSFGTLTALALGGGMQHVGARRDPSVVAVMGYSSPGRIPGLVTSTAYAGDALPAMIVTGDKDLVPGFVSDWRDHLFPVETAPAGDKYGVVLAGAGHAAVGAASEAQYDRAVQLGTMFLQAYLLDDAAAASALKSDAREGETWLRR